MSAHFGEFRADAAYTVEAISRILGMSLRETRELLEDHFEIVPYGRGRYIVPGVCLLAGLERMARHQPTEKGEAQERPETITKRRSRKTEN